MRPLRIIYDSQSEGPDNKAAEVDVVAVHGLNFKNNDDHSTETWTKGDKLWLRDFLPSALSKPARVMLFTYNSSPYMGAAAMKVDDHARALLQAILLKRTADDMSQRPIVFICHSLGGIVVKSALVEATLDPKYQPIVRATRLLVFFATPHQGGNYADVGEIAVKIARFSFGGLRNDLLIALRENSDASTRRFEQARHLFQNFVAVSFFETKSYGKLGIIVDKKSATLNLPGETQVGCEADHSLICKFDSDEECELVVGTIAYDLDRALELGHGKEPCLVPSSNNKVTFPIEGNKHWLVPRSNNTRFTGRTRVIASILKAITTPREDVKRCFVLTGMGGQGKSEVCLQVVTRVREQFWAVFWVDVSDAITAKKGFSKISELLGSPSTDIDSARTALSNIPNENHWMLVLDNADDPEFDYSRYFPSGHRGVIIVTSRNPKCGSAHQTVGWEKLENLDEDDSVSLLLKAVGVPEASWDEQRADALAAVRAVDHHTLAILQAGTYIGDQRCTMAEYPVVLERNRKTLMEFHHTQGKSRYGNVFATLEISMQALGQSSNSRASHDALQLLQFLSTLHNEGMPLDVLHSAWEGAQKSQKVDADEQRLGYLTSWHVSQLPDFLKPHNDTWDSDRLSDAVVRLESLALIRRDQLQQGASPSISMHSLVHEWAALRQTLEQRLQTFQTSECILAHSEYSDGNWRPWWNQFGPHLQRLLRNDGLFVERAALSRCLLQVFERLAVLLYYLNHYQELGYFVERMLSRLGLNPEEPSQELGNLYLLVSFSAKEKGNYKLSISIMQKLVEMDNASQDSNVAGRLQRQGDLASAYLRDGQYKTAIEGLQKILADVNFSLLDERDQDFMQYTLAQSYLGDGRVEKAIEIFEEVATAKERLPENDTNRLATLRELAGAYLENGQVAQAIEHLEGIVKLYRRHLHETNQSRLASEYKLARAYLVDGRVSDAIAILEHVVTIWTRTFNESHPGHLASQHELARAYLEDNRAKESISLLEHVVSTKRSVLSEDNRSLLTSQQVLGVTYLADGRVAEAIELLEHVVDTIYAASWKDDELLIDAQSCLHEGRELLRGDSSTSHSQESASLAESMAGTSDFLQDTCMERDGKAETVQEDALDGGAEVLGCELDANPQDSRMVHLARTPDKKNKKRKLAVLFKRMTRRSD